MKIKDDIYKNKKDIIPPFSFDKQVATVFDDMACRSIPLYHDLQTITARLIKYFYRRDTVIYDIGCSTGNTIVEIIKYLDENCRIVAVDKSAEMLDIARQKCTRADIQWLHTGVEDVRYHNASVINSSYVLQFVEPALREEILKKMYSGLTEGGILLLSEKTCIDNEHIETVFTKLYEDFKLANNYSRLEIEQKKEALKSILIPFTLEHYIALLQKTGFSSIQIITKYLNFVSILAVK